MATHRDSLSKQDTILSDLPLIFEKLELSRMQRGERPADSDLLEYFAEIGEGFNWMEFEKRYNELLQEDGSFHGTPANERFTDTFTRPLKNAKVNYLLGNFQGTTALCGFVAEMCTVFTYDLALYIRNREGSHLVDAISLQEFEHKRQKSRIELLHKLDFINTDFKNTLLEINNLRNSYLHGYRMSTQRVQEDAKRAYGMAIRLLKATIGQETHGSILDGWKKGATVTVIVASPDVLEFLEQCWQAPKRRLSKQ